MGVFSTLHFRRKCPRCKRMGNMESQFKYAIANYATCLDDYKIGDRVPWKEFARKGVSFDFSDIAALKCSQNAQREGDIVIESTCPTYCDKCPELPDGVPLLGICTLEADIEFNDYTIVGVRRVYRVDTLARVEHARVWQGVLEILHKKPYSSELWNEAADRGKAHMVAWRKARRKIKSQE